MLNKNVKLWLRALRSGKYKQSYDYLSTKSGFCCLGVACEVYQAKVGDLRISRNLQEKGIECHRYGNESDCLPDKVRKWLGMKDKKGYIRSLATNLVCMNDDNKFKFTKIADKIEKHADELFK